MAKFSLDSLKKMKEENSKKKVKKHLARHFVKPRIEQFVVPLEFILLFSFLLSLFFVSLRLQYIGY